MKILNAIINLLGFDLQGLIPEEREVVNGKYSRRLKSNVE